jgi:hypothetical protein
LSTATDVEPPGSLQAGELGAEFARAAGRTGTAERSYRIGGRPLRLRFAGSALLERLTPSLQHLADEDGHGGGHLVEIWDGASSDGPSPPAPPGSEALPPSGIATSQGEGRRVIFQKGVGTLSAVDVHRDRSWYWAPDAALLPEWECATPLRHILHLWLSAHGIQFVHAGAVGRPEGGFIITGRSGSGKSTTTLSTLGSDLLYAGDDYVAVGAGPDDGPYVHSVFGCGKLEPDHVARFPALRFAARAERAGALPARREKIVFYVRDTYPAQVTTGFPLRGIIVPRIEPGSRTQLAELSRPAALRALVPSTMLEIHGTGQAALSMLVRAAEQVPSYELRLGSDLERVPEILDTALGS